MSCKGCKTKIDASQFIRVNKCIIRTNTPNKNCPCEVCVIKPMCSDQCEDFYNLLVSIFKISLSYDYKSVSPDKPTAHLIYQPYYRRLF
jgi:hypothetical protein